MFIMGKTYICNAAPENIYESPSFVENMKRFIGKPLTVASIDHNGHATLVCKDVPVSYPYQWNFSWVKEVEDEAKAKAKVDLFNFNFCSVEE